MNLSQLIDGLEYKFIGKNIDIDIKGIEYNSNNVKKGYIFVCITGLGVDRHLYIEDAIKNGAVAIIVEKDVNIHNAVILRVENARIALACISKIFYEKSDEKLKLIGVTGTNGKTTITYMIQSILKSYGKKIGLIGTIANYVNNEKINSTSTTPESLELHRLFKNMVDNDVEYCIMEVSSHSLALNRVYDLYFFVSIFTNLTQDHLDFHKTFENYFDAKCKLFTMSRYCVINLDDSYGNKILNKSTGFNITYAINKQADFVAEDIKNGTFYLKDQKYEGVFEVGIPGIYNVYNSLSVIAALNTINIPMNNIKYGLKNVFVPGRFVIISKNYNLNFNIILDFAHTPDSLKKLIMTAKEYANGKVVTVIGCGGDRDKTKRPVMGKISTELSDYVFLTSDNPRSEEPLDIINDIKSGIVNNNYEIVIDRKEAIKRAILYAKKDDIVLIAGKGHEDYQVLKQGKVPFDESIIIDDIIKGELL